jgi:hypothetical protein
MLRSHSTTAARPLRWRWAGRPMIKRFAEGLNYQIDLDGSKATCRVWSRPDIDSTQGAAMAVEKVSHFRHLAQTSASSMLFDLTQAPAVTGPKTQQALGDMLSSWQAAGKPVAVVTGAHSIQQLQLRRLLATFAPDQSALFVSLEEAGAWLEAKRRKP